MRQILFDIINQLDDCNARAERCQGKGAWEPAQAQR